MSTEWLTYAEAADSLGIKVESVKRQARAKKWGRRIMNDGVAQIAIPTDRLPDDRSDNPPDRPAPDQTPELSARLAAAEVRAEMAERRANEIAEDRDRWRGMAERLSERQSVSIWDRLFKR